LLRLGHDHHLLVDARLGQHEGFAHLVVEALGHIARELEVLLLVLAHGHHLCIVQQDVRRHEHGVGKKPAVHVLQPVGLVLEAVGQGQARVGEEAIEVPGELGDLGHIALAVEHGALGIQPAGEPGGRHAVRVVAQHGGLLDLGERMQVGDEQEAVVAGLAAGVDGGADGAEHVAQVGRAGALDAGEDTGHVRGKVGQGRMRR